MQFKFSYLNQVFIILLLFLPFSTFSEITSEQLMQLETTAIDGDIHAQTQLASMYYLGEGVQQNHQQAFSWYKLAAEQGDKNSQYSLGNLYLLGEGVAADQEQARYWYQQAAAQGHSAATVRLEKLSQDNVAEIQNEIESETNRYAGAPIDQPETVAANETSAEKKPETDSGLFDQLFGTTESKNTETIQVEDKSKDLTQPKRSTPSRPAENKTSDKQLPNSDLQPGPIVKQDELEEKIIFEEITEDNPQLFGLHKKATEGDASAQYLLGNAFYQGRGVTQNFEQAFLWYRRSAENGNPDAQFQLGNVYLMGEGVNQSDDEAMYWYEQAANQNHPDAQNNLESLQQYIQAQTTPTPDNKPAVVDSFETNETVESSSAESDYQQGMKYSIGDGVERDYKAAFNYFKSAADNGHVRAQYQLGIAYAFGEGVEKNMNKSFEWISKSAYGGDLLAQRQLASMYLSGNGVEKNNTKAAAWYQIVANQGNQMDLQRLDEIKAELTDEQSLESERLAAKLLTDLPPTN